MDLFEAIEHDDPAAVKAAIAAGADLNAWNFDYGQTALEAAVAAGNAAIVDLLLDAGASPNRFLTTPPLTLAVLRGDREMATTLLNAGANANAGGEDGVTALLTAAAIGNVDLVMLLLDAGASPDVRDREGYTASSVAAAAGHADIAHLLLARRSS